VARKLGLQLGQRFVGSHGLGAGGHAHGDSAYQVVGVLAATGGVLDRLILTDTASVWKAHEDYSAADDEDRKVMEEEREVTMALVRYKSPLAALSFPRWVNTSTEMQAAAPAPSAAVKTDKPRKPKLVRDSFTIPKAEYGAIDRLQTRATQAGRPAKKSELLRAGLMALEALGDPAFLAALKAVPAIKTGRPAKS